MTSKQQSKLNAYLLVRILCNGNNLVWQTLLAFAAAFGLFSARIDALISNARLQEELLTGYAKLKQQRKTTMAELADAMRQKMQVYCSVTENPVLFKLVDYSFNKIMRMSSNSSLNAARTINTEAQKNMAVLKDYGILPAEIVALEAAITGFSDAMVMPRQAISQVKDLTKLIKEDISFIDKMLNTRMSKLMVQFKKSAPQFYAAFFTQKRPVSAPTHVTEFDLFVKSTQGTPLQGVTITAIGSTKTYSGKTDNTGQLPLKKVSPDELYDLHFEFPGFNPAELHGVKIAPGEHEKITVELTPVNGNLV